MTNCEVYNTTKKSTCIFVKRKEDLAKIPESIQKSLGPFTYKSTVDIDLPIVAADHKQVKVEIAKDGYSIKSGKIVFKIETLKRDSLPTKPTKKK